MWGGSSGGFNMNIIKRCKIISKSRWKLPRFIVIVNWQTLHNLFLCLSWMKLSQGRESPTISTKLKEMFRNSVDW